MTGFTSKRQATADKLDDDDAQGYIAQFEEALQKEYQRGYDAGKASQPEQEPVEWATREDFYLALDRRVERIRKEMEIKTVTMRCKDYDVALTIIDMHFGHVFVGQVSTPPKRPWVGLTAQEAADCWTTSATQTWKNFEAALKKKNT